MEKNENDGVSYLLALKQTIGTASGAAAVPAREPGQQPGSADFTSPDPTFQGSEKRRSLRYKCEGSAQIREEGRDVRTWATFTDVSLHGCYVEAQATYPAGTILHLQLGANDIRLEVKGKVRVNYPYLGMGIAFVEMSPDNEARLRQLLATISHPCVIVGPGIASSLPTTSALGDLPVLTNPEAAVQELIDFFESRQMLMREDFMRLLRKSQNPDPKK
jgi:PilZ domain-containing protein